MSSSARIYLDNAATSWPKPDVVYEVMDRYQRENGAAAGRAGYGNAEQANRIIENTRLACAQLLGISNPHQIAFTSNGTDALNLAIHGLLQPGDHVVTTVCEHNSVLRPLYHQATQNDVTVTYVGCNAEGYVSPDEVSNAIQSKTRLVAITHASNVTGAVQPIAEITQLAHERDALVLLDAAQSAGCIDTNVEQLGVDLLATGGHKGMLGPLGTGLLYLAEQLTDRFLPLKQGGTGTDSLSELSPATMPAMLEAGNLNVPAIAGLGEAANYLASENTHNKQHLITLQLLEGLEQIAGIRVFGPTGTKLRGNVVSFGIEGYDPQEFATALDAMSNIQCRAGLHCAPRMHAALETDQSGGLVRLSPGWATTSEEIEQTLATIQALSVASTK